MAFDFITYSYLQLAAIDSDADSITLYIRRYSYMQLATQLKAAWIYRIIYQWCTTAQLEPDLKYCVT